MIEKPKSGGQIMSSHNYSKAALLSVAISLILALLFTPCAAMNVEIANIDIDNYPGIHVFVRVTDDLGNYIADLSAYNFEVRENGILLDIYCEPQFGYMAVSLVMDESGSMAGYEQDVMDACNFFVNGLDGLDKAAIVKFATTAYLDVPMTYDREALHNSINSYQTSGWTDLYDAIYLGIQECFYEPEKKAAVTFTDGNDNQPGVYACQLPEFAGSDITLYTIGIGNISPDSLIYISEQTGGFYLPIENTSQMQSVLEDIRADIDNLYDLYYETPDPSLGGNVRAIEVVCNYAGETAWDTSSYIAPMFAPPEIALSSSTAQLLGVAQPPQNSLHIACQVECENDIDDARIYWKRADETYFHQNDLNPGAPSYYYYDIPANEVQDPGILFYLQVTDELGNTATLPEYNPGVLPFSIPVLSNEAPDIDYQAPPIWLTNQTMDIEITVEDETSQVEEVTLYYRIPGSFFYNDVEMDDLGGDTYSCTILGPELNERYDMEFFIAAWDNYGVANYWNSSDDPYFLDVVWELQPTYPANVLEPEEPSIVIPPYGGQFYYTLYVINPIPDYQDCDAWAEMLLPDGTIQDLELVIEEIVLGGGAQYVDYFLQTIPDTAMAGNYELRFYTGDLENNLTYYSATIPFEKSGSSDGGGQYTSWAWERITKTPYETQKEQVLFAEDLPMLSRGYPNPFNASTALDYYLPEDSYITLAIYNIAGKEVARLADGFHPTGRYTVHWDAAQVASGVYFVNLVTSKGIFTTRLNLIK
jgi:VWFA-related protein